MNSVRQQVNAETSWAAMSRQSGFNTTKAMVDDAALIAAGYDEVIDILDDGEMVLTQLSQPLKAKRVAGGFR